MQGGKEWRSAQRKHHLFVGRTNMLEHAVAVDSDC